MGVTAQRRFELEGRSLRYAYDHWTAGETGRAVVCVHGITRNRHDFAFLAERLRAALDVYAVDLIGHGDSEWLDAGSIYEKEMFLAQLQDLIASVGGRRVGLVGSSYGGLMGVRLAALPDSPLSCLVLNDAGVGIRKEFYEETAKKIAFYPTFGSMRSAEGWMKLVMQNAGTLAPEMFDEIVKHAIRTTPRGEYVLAYDRELPRVWLGNHNRTPEPWSLWEDITCPVLLIRGARSEVLTSEVVAEMKRRKPRLEVADVEGAGHFPHLMDATQTAPIERWLAANL
jgi:pimeloyl-ACP methyl ester carboxylesterase